VQCVDGDTVNATTRFHQFNSIESTSVEIGDPMNTNAIRGELEAKERKVSTKNLPTHTHLRIRPGVDGLGYDCVLSNKGNGYFSIPL
jgi:hypothetical protein